ncbi:hypothetical protein AXG93_939s1290 [Marchantia polymorpha subsp. ruderalis]|uniref:Uncharacterized protein n=1 Tax=Marchantia polymorpha subsp. ruderalis TaxID=1480154 RepID=A0A176VMT3_MARPO|nr:hypothetical protein AXG93_939s1290 [Marchantia polymorpha subsp. ruderalis]
MPEYEDDGSEEDSMANFMGAEERGGHSHDENEEADDSTENAIVHENDEVQHQSASEREYCENGSERRNDSNAIGEEGLPTMPQVKTMIRLPNSPAKEKIPEGGVKTLAIMQARITQKYISIETFRQEKEKSSVRKLEAALMECVQKNQILL